MPSDKPKLIVPENILVPVVLSTPSGLGGLRTYSGWGLIDTGCTKTCVKPKVIEHLGLRQVGTTWLGSVMDNTPDLPVYDGCISIHPKILGSARGRFVAKDFDPGQTPALQGLDVLIGNDVLKYLRFRYDGPANRVDFEPG